jgi:hypothetical protein
VRPALREDNLAMSSSAVKAAFLSLALIAVRNLVFAVSKAVMSVADQIRPVLMGFHAVPTSDAARLALFQSPLLTDFLVLSMAPRISPPAGVVGVGAGVLGRVGAGLVNLVGRGAVGFCLVPTFGHAAPPRINAKTIKSAVNNSEILQPLRYRSTCVHLLRTYPPIGS